MISKTIQVCQNIAKYMACL